MSKVYDIRSFTVSSEAIQFIIADETVSIPLKHCGSTRLAAATNEERMFFDIDQDGLGVHWPLIDEDLSISGLLKSAGRVDLVKPIPSVIYQPNEE